METEALHRDRIWEAPEVVFIQAAPTAERIAVRHLVEVLI
jgi:hypothetical protein